MTYYCHTHMMDRIARPTLFRQNGIPHEEKLENLAILLDVDNISCAAALLTPDKETPVPQPTALGINELCVVVWLNAKAEYEWFIGYVTAVDNSIYSIDHLHRKQQSLDTEWKYPSKEDVQRAEERQIV